MNTKHFGIEYRANFPLSESVFQKIVFKLLCNLNVAARGAKLILSNNELWHKTSDLFNKLDFEVADFEEDDLKKLINELRFLKHCVSGCSCNVPDKASFKLISWVDLFGPLNPFELQAFCDALKVEYSILSDIQFNHILQSTDSDIQKTTLYLSNWWMEMPQANLDLILDKINIQKLERNQDKTLATKS